jgi:uncharacterized protein YbjT (DUF2867 family)
METRPVLVTGATGYLGGRLIPLLLAAGYRVRGMARSLNKLRGRSWADHPRLELAQADALNAASMNKAVQGCSAAYYLIHSMNTGDADFARIDRRAASNFVRASAKAHLERIIYLGGLGGESDEASRHLISRFEVGRILKSGPVPVTIFQSAHILGSGSASFEILRYLADRLPLVFVSARVIDTKVQPICIRNVLHYLVECLEKNETVGETFDLGGPDVLTYRQLLELYAEEAGVHRPIFITPNIPPIFDLGRKFGIFFAQLFMPVSPSIAKPLLEGAATQVIAREDRINKIIPQDLMTCREAIRRAIQKDSLQIVETRWTDAGELKPPEWVHVGDAPYAGGTLLQGGFKVDLAASPGEIWPIISRIGGYNGWYYGDFLWKLRGWMDILNGGVGLRRGRRHPERLIVGDALDFWRVLEVDPPGSLILVAEMKLPGEATLDFKLVPVNGMTELRLATRFRPKGLYGLIYWYFFLPFHDLLFGGMLREIARRVDCPIVKGPEKFRPGPIY